MKCEYIKWDGKKLAIYKYILGAGTMLPSPLCGSLTVYLFACMAFVRYLHNNALNTLEAGMFDHLGSLESL